MIREFTPADLDAVMQIWLQSNLDAHPFVPAAYWEENFPAVRAALPQASVLIEEENHVIRGFLGLMDDYIAGIFVSAAFRSHGVGKRLLDEAKKRRNQLTLHVYEKNDRAAAFYLREGFRRQSAQTDENTGAVELLLKWTR